MIEARQVFVRWHPGTKSPSHEKTVIGIWEKSGAAKVIYQRPDERWCIAPGMQPCLHGAPDWWADQPRNFSRGAIPTWAFRWAYRGRLRSAIARLYIRFCRLWAR